MAEAMEDLIALVAYCNDNTICNLLYRQIAKTAIPIAVVLFVVVSVVVVSVVVVFFAAFGRLRIGFC